MEAVKVFLDTNVVLDYYTGRMGDSIAKTIVMAGQTPQIELCISILTAVNVLYVSRKYNSPLKAKDIAELFQILPMDYSKRLRDDAFEAQRKQGVVPCYSFFHLSGRRFLHASGVRCGRSAALLSTSER